MSVLVCSLTEQILNNASLDLLPFTQSQPNGPVVTESQLNPLSMNPASQIQRNWENSGQPNDFMVNQGQLNASVINRGQLNAVNMDGRALASHLVTHED